MRHESLFFLFSPVTRLKGVGASAARSLANLLPAATARADAGAPIVRDLLFHLPSNIVDRRLTFPLSEARESVVATFVVTVDAHVPPPVKRGSRRPYKVLCSNDTGSLTLVFFHAREDYLKQALPLGARRAVSGRVEVFDYQWQMTHPDIITPAEELASVQRVEPVYPLTLGLTSRRIGKIVEGALAKLPDLPEWQKEPALPFKTSLLRAHHPESEADLDPGAPARARLAYDEMLAHQLHLAGLRAQMRAQAGEIIQGDGRLTQALAASLPFALTQGQKEADAAIARDMASGRRMARLLQGDVGSGKTVVALLSMLRAAEEGKQSAIMAPTEMLARQHDETLLKLTSFLRPHKRNPSPLEGEGGEHSEPGEGYSEATLGRAKSLRINLTDAEKKLWQLLRNRQLEKYKFRRQQPIGPYIADFFCAEYGLILEIDGGQHAKNISQDKERTSYLISKGYRVLRFWNHDVLQNIEGVYDQISRELKNTPHPNPLPQGERELKIVLLTGSVKGRERAAALDAIASGEASIVVGTHALFQEQVEFKNLALCVIDEQHRFGVHQRMALTAKGEAPHLLHLSATPIPRSLAMTLYGDMDVSALREKPAGRQAVTTRVIPLSRYGEVVERMDAALKRGEKAYWICPMVEGDADEDVAAVKSRHKEFAARFGDIVGLAHGRMKADARAAQMKRFAEGDTRLLVATTVVEVGVDVPDATIMVVERAERFGLSQLHQLRGRVGRSDKASACVLLYSDGAGEEARQRLSVLRDTDDGFAIAEADLAGRGGGDVLGRRQSGLPRFIFVDIFAHQALLAKARDEAKAILETDPGLQSGRGQALRILLQLFEKE